MNKKSPFIKWMTMAFIVATASIGYGAGSFVYKTNIYIARGILGFAFLYFLYREFNFIAKNFGANTSFDELLTFPPLTFFVITFGASLFFYFGLHDIIQLVIFVMRSFIVKTP